MVERTLVFIKPDGVKRNLIGQILSRFEEKGITISALNLKTLTDLEADYHYHEHVEKGFYPSLRGFVTSGPVVLMVLEGDNVIEVVRRMVGDTDGQKAAPGTIRGDYSMSKAENVIHASDSPQSAAREIKHFFPHL